MTFEHWTLGISRARSRPSEHVDGQTRPAQAYLEAVSTLTEEVTATDFGAGRSIGITHPVMGIRSWYRYIPEAGAAVAVTQRSDTAAPEILYYLNSNATRKIESYRKGVGHYRQMTPGEHEISSSGFAQMFWSHRGNLHLRGGIVRGWLHADDLEVGFKGPTHRRLLHDHSHEDALIGEERFGLVWRKGDDHTERRYIKKDGDYAREYVRSINFEGAPGELVSYHEGHVVDRDGELILSPIRTPLRVFGRWYAQSGDPLIQQVDEDGNVWWTLPDSAQTGWTFSIPGGTFRVMTGSKVQIGARSDVELTGQNMTILARNTLTIRGSIAVNLVSDGAVVIEAPNVTIKGRIVTDSPTAI